MSDASKFKDSEGTLVNVKDAQARADIATINSNLAQRIFAGISKTKSVTISGNSTTQVGDSDYLISGKTYIGTLIYSYGGANVSITVGYGGMSTGVLFSVRNFNTNSLTIDIVYRHLYIG